MNLLPNEEQVVTSNSEKIILTNLRIQMTDEYWGSSYKIVLFLEDISSIEQRFKSNVIFLLLGCLGFIAGLYISSQSYNEGSFNIGYVAGAVFIVLWWFSRRHVVSISSDSGRALTFEVGQMSKDLIDSFIDDVQLAKLKRVNQLFKASKGVEV
jgi:hypothetical protein